MSGVAQRISYKLRQEISQKINRLPMAYFDRNSKGDIISRVTNDVDTLSQTLNQSLMQMITSIITVVGVFIMMLSINLMMTIAALVVMPLTMLVLSLVIRKSQVFFKQQQKYLGDMNGKIFNRIPLIHKLKWREYVGVKCLWGYLSEKNNPLLEQNAGDPNLMYFPEGVSVMDMNRPYVELVAGIHNIFKILHVEYVRRLTYLDLPTAHKHGIRFMLQMTF